MRAKNLLTQLPSPCVSVCAIHCRLGLIFLPLLLFLIPRLFLLGFELKDRFEIPLPSAAATLYVVRRPVVRPRLVGRCRPPSRKWTMEWSERVIWLLVLLLWRNCTGEMGSVSGAKMNCFPSSFPFFLSIATLLCLAPTLTILYTASRWLVWNYSARSLSRIV